MDYGIIVDVETTGLDPRRDRIIEIGVLEFVVNAGEPPAIVSTYGALEDPLVPLAPEIVELTGLTNAVLQGRTIDWQRVGEMLGGASVVIAHNAPFDRAFIEARPELASLNLHWACSIKHLPWRQLGFKSASLTYLAADHGFLNPFPHRAIFDCATTFKLVAPHLSTLINRSYEREWIVAATGAAFEVKDLLRSQGYRWDPQQRVWQKMVLACDLDVERQFLVERIYASGISTHQEFEAKGISTEYG